MSLRSLISGRTLLQLAMMIFASQRSLNQPKLLTSSKHSVGRPVLNLDWNES